METESISVGSPAVNVTTETVDETTSQESNSVSQDTGKSSSEKQQPSVEDSEDYETPEPEDENDSVNGEELAEEKGDEESGVEDEGSETGSEEGSVTGSEEGSVEVPVEREEGDGEEESDKKERPLDRDEDKRDPQYIPKKGNFYEHDDRTSETDEPQPPKKPVAVAKTCDAKERWGHDMYDDDLQSPKSRNELMDQYGYDIRDEEGPPKARRRRRYGRGPNKYTRHWEEEEAYSKSGRGGGGASGWRGGSGSGGPRGGRGGSRPGSRGPPRPQDFPPLPSILKDDGYENKKEVEKPPIPEPPKKEEVEKPKTQEAPVAKSEAPPAVTSSPHQLPPQVQRNVYVRKVEMKPQQRHPPGSRTAGGGSEGFGGSGGSSKMEGRMRIRAEDFGPPQPNLGSRGRGRHPASSYRGLSAAEQDIATLSQHFSEAVINVDSTSFGPQRGSSLPPMDVREEKQHRGDKEKSNSEGGKTRQQQQGGTAKNGGEHQSGPGGPEQGSGKSKRYSTQRQRSLPQANLQSAVPPQGPVAHQLPPPPPPQQQRYMQEGYYHAGVEGGPPPPVPPPPNFQQPGFTEPLPVMAFIPPPTGQFPPLYVPPPPTYLPPPPPIPVQSPRPAEVYQGGGITYYNTQSQVPRPIATSRRIKLAIPIVAPPQESQPSST